MNEFINLKKLTLRIIFTSIWGVLMLIPQSTKAQISSPNTGNIDDLPDDPQQMRIWTCNHDNQAILVETKNVKIWTGIIETKGWQCAEKLSTIPDNSPQFSCESDSGDINIITVTWLTEKADKQQMTTWINAFQDQSMICTTDKTNPFWN